MKKIRFWTRLYPFEAFEGSSYKNLRAWPKSLNPSINAHREEHDSSLVFSPDDRALAERVVAEFKNSTGFTPFSRRVPEYQPGGEEKYPFYALGISGPRVAMKSEVNFDRQKDCGNQIPEPLVTAGMGCGNGKVQCKSLSLASPRSGSLPDLFRLDTGPRLPSGRVFGVSERLKQAMVERCMTGCEFRAILLQDGKTPSGLFQVTITADTRGPILLARVPAKVLSCSVCGYWFTSRIAPGFGVPIPRALFSDNDVQLMDRFSFEGKAFRLDDSVGVTEVVSWRLVQLLREGNFTGWYRASRMYDFEPILLEEHLHDAPAEPGTN